MLKRDFITKTRQKNPQRSIDQTNVYSIKIRANIVLPISGDERWYFATELLFKQGPKCQFPSHDDFYSHMQIACVILGYSGVMFKWNTLKLTYIT